MLWWLQSPIGNNLEVQKNKKAYIYCMISERGYVAKYKYDKMNIQWCSLMQRKL